MNTTTHYYLKRWGGRCVLAVSAAVLSVAAYAGNAIESVTASMQGGSEVIRVTMSEPLSAPPAGFVVQNPARIALDFPGVSSKMARAAIELNQGNLRAAQVVQGESRTRVVLNLKQSTTYKTSIDGKALLIVLDPVAAAAQDAPRIFAEGRNAGILPLRNIDFRRGTNNSGRIVIDLPNNQVGVDIKPQGQSLVVEFLKSSLPAALHKKLDVADFGTPVNTVTTTQAGDKVKMIIAARGEWEHSAYQSDNQLVVELHPSRVDPNKLTQGAGYRGEKLSLNFQNVEIRALLQVIADFTSFNIITSDSVTGNLTLRLKDVPWDQALDVILQAKDLGMRKTGNVIRIAPKDEMDNTEKREMEARADITKLEPLRTQSFQLSYAKAEVVAKMLEGDSNTTTNGKASTRMLSERGAVSQEQRTNQLFVKDVPSVLEQVAAMIAKLDVPVRQVMVEARMVEAKDSWGQSLGVKLGIGTGGTQHGANIGSSNGRDVLVGFGDVGNNGVNNFYSLPAAGGLANSGFNPAALAVSIFSKGASRFLNLEISALEADGKGKVISNPRVVTTDQIKATIEQGVNLPYLEASSSGATSIKYQKAVLKLEVTPQITPEGGVIMDVDITNDSVGAPTIAGYAIDTKRVQTNVLVENGGTVVIGGIFTMSEGNDVSKVPLLGDIPIIGNLFKPRKSVAEKREMLIFITPRVMTERAILR